MVSDCRFYSASQSQSISTHGDLVDETYLNPVDENLELPLVRGPASIRGSPLGLDILGGTLRGRSSGSCKEEVREVLPLHLNWAAVRYVDVNSHIVCESAYRRGTVVSFSERSQRQVVTHNECEGLNKLACA